VRLAERVAEFVYGRLQDHPEGDSRPIAANKARAKRHLMCVNVPAPSPALSAGRLEDERGASDGRRLKQMFGVLIVLMTAYKLYQLVL
jgi:hypothetical protein